jgi:hypothetical protein
MTTVRSKRQLVTQSPNTKESARVEEICTKVTYRYTADKMANLILFYYSTTPINKHASSSKYMALA